MFYGLFALAWPEQVALNDWVLDEFTGQPAGRAAGAVGGLSGPGERPEVELDDFGSSVRSQPDAV